MLNISHRSSQFIYSPVKTKKTKKKHSGELNTSGVIKLPTEEADLIQNTVEIRRGLFTRCSFREEPSQSARGAGGGALLLLLPHAVRHNVVIRALIVKLWEMVP